MFAPSKTGCFVRGALNGGAGTVGAALLTAAVATVAAPEVVSAGLLIAGGIGAAALIRDFSNSGATGRAYDAGAFVGGALAGGPSSFGARFSITGETNLPTGFLDFLGVNKVTNPSLGPISGAFAKGPDLLGGAAALLGVGSGGSILGKGNCK